VPTATRRATDLPRLEVVIPRLRDWVAPRSLGRVTRDRNVTGHRPLRIAYLRVFDNGARATTFVQGAWREFGYVYGLRSAKAIDPRELRALRHGGGRELIVSGDAALDAALAASPSSPLPPGRNKIRGVSTYVIPTRDRYGAYPMTMPLCHGAYWRRAVDRLLAMVDVVALDLSGIQEHNLSTAYEVQRVIDRVPVERVVFLADRRSSTEYIEELLRLAWTRMAADSPNASGERRGALFVPTDRFITPQTRNANGTVTQQRTRLMADRRESRKLCALLESRAAGERPVDIVSDDGHGTSRRFRVAAVVVAVVVLAAAAVAAVQLSRAGGAASSVAAPVIAQPQPTIGPRPSEDTPSSTQGSPSPAESVFAEDVRGEPVDQATETLTKLGFTVTEQPTIAPNAVPGTVVDQQPRSGFLRARITIVLSVATSDTGTATDTDTGTGTATDTDTGTGTDTDIGTDTGTGTGVPGPGGGAVPGLAGPHDPGGGRGAGDRGGDVPQVGASGRGRSR
jgi:hypothetical protein